MKEPGEAAGGAAKVAVVTVTYSPGEHLERFISSLATATSAKPPVVLADNGSTDGAPELAAESNQHVSLLRTGANLGYGGAINRAVAQLDPTVEFVVIANPDVQWGANTIDELLAAAQRWPQAGALGPLIRTPEGGVYPSARSVPGLFDGAGHAVFADIWPSNPWTRRYRRDDMPPVERAAGWLSGSCLLVRRKAFEAIGGFDARYFMYLEDVDFGDRLGRAGWLNVYVPSVEITHAHGHSTTRHPEMMLAVHHASAYRFQADRHPHWWQAPLRLVLRVGLALRCRIAVRSAHAA